MNEKLAKLEKNDGFKARAANIQIQMKPNHFRWIDRFHRSGDLDNNYR